MGNMGEIRLTGIKKAFGKDVVIPNLALKIDDGSFTVLVGPSGCGKSTTLRMIAGLEMPTEGSILIDNEDVTNRAPGSRGIAMVFQNYAIYPTMTVRGNIEFGLINNKVPKQERNRLIADIAEIVGLTPYLDRKPNALSGGQRQRVALARAMVKKPKVFLLDEPLSNLDAKLRAAMRVELKELHKRLKTTFIYVTHDQVEAMSMADNIVLMDKGVIQQQSSPAQIYHCPQNVFTACFIGTPPMNIFPQALEGGKKLGVRPEKISLQPIAGEHLRLKVEVSTKEMLGAECIYYCTSKLGNVVIKAAEDVDDPNLTVHISYGSLHMFDADSRRIELTQALKNELARISD